jgi:hypothetical protein
MDPNGSGRWVIVLKASMSAVCQAVRRNAEIIAEAVTKYISGPSQRLILLGYSKGTTDILHFLVAYPELALRIEAVLSVAGAVNGSPLADRYTDGRIRQLARPPLSGKMPARGSRGVRQPQPNAAVSVVGHPSLA